jgi:intein/homing endonuclease
VAFDVGDGAPLRQRLGYNLGRRLHMFKFIVTVFLAGVLIAPVLGCHKKGPAEKAGEQIDKKVEEVTGEKSKTFEKAGEQMDEAVEDAKKEIEDAQKDLEKESDH